MLVNTVRSLFALWICAALVSCDIYDEMPQMPVGDSGDSSYTYIDATSYTQWIYLNLEDGTSVVLPYDDADNVPDQWTFAMHRYDCKTNGGMAMETKFSTLDALVSALSEGTFDVEGMYVADVEDSIIIDMSHMLDGWLVYAPSPVNKELGKWLNVDISDMPPIYTPSDKVYLICTQKGVYCAVRFMGYTNPYYYDAKGYISFDYIYPLNL